MKSLVIHFTVQTCDIPILLNNLDDYPDIVDGAGQDLAIDSNANGRTYRYFVFLFLCRMDGEDVRLMLWDTAGQEEFDAITKAYYRGAQACVLAFSTTDRDSFEAIHSWKMKVREFALTFQKMGKRALTL